MNTAVFAGRAGQAAQLNKTKGGDSVANFSLAVDRFKKDDGPLWSPCLCGVRIPIMASPGD